jgi:hypothetical protein
MKNGFHPREVSRFVLAENPTHFTDLGDVLHGRASWMKAQQDSQKQPNSTGLECAYDMTF